MKPEKLDYASLLAEFQAQTAGPVAAIKTAPCVACRTPDSVLAGRTGPDAICDGCRRQGDDDRRAIATNGERHFPPKYKSVRFESRLAADPSHVRAARDLVERFPLERTPNVVLVGQAGSGKTTLAIAMARLWIAKHRKSVCFVSALELVAARSGYPLGAGEAPIIREAKRARVLILDDLGQEKQDRDGVVTELIFARDGSVGPTWVTTGVGVDRAAAEASVKAQYGDGVARRLFEGAIVFDLSVRPLVQQVTRPATLRRVTP